MKPSILFLMLCALAGCTPQPPAPTVDDEAPTPSMKRPYTPPKLTPLPATDPRVVEMLAKVRR